MTEPGGQAAVLRPLRGDDVPRCLEIFYTALDDLYDRTGQPRLPRNPTPLAAVLEHLLATDPGRCWVTHSEGAEGALTAFGAAYRRSDFWYLALLFVDPPAQAAGLGRRILSAALPVADGVLRATCVDSVQPISAALYARFGLVPRLPLFTLTGTIRPEVLPDMPAVVEAVPFETVAASEAGHGRLIDAVAAVDQEVLGYERPADHALWRRDGRRGFLIRHRVSGRPIGYGYLRPSGRLGPLAVLDPALAPAVLGVLFRSFRPPDAWQLIVPGPFAESLVPLLDAGMRLDGLPGLFASSAPLTSLERYLPASFALL